MDRRPRAQSTARGSASAHRPISNHMLRPSGIASVVLLILFVGCDADDSSAPTKRPRAHGLVNTHAFLAPERSRMSDEPSDTEATSAVEARQVASRDRAHASSRVEATRRRLERSASGLLYTSESDYPFTYYRSTTPVALPLTPAGFRTAIGLSSDAPIEEISLEEFFARHVERVDPNDEVAVRLVPRYRHLRSTIHREVHAPRVYRCGHVQVQCYVGRQRRCREHGGTHDHRDRDEALSIAVCVREGARGEM